GRLLILIPSLSRINAWKRFRATNCVGISKRWSSPRWSGARRTDWRYCIGWKKPVAGCCDSRKGRCIRPFTGSKKPAPVKAVWESEPHGRRGARRRIYQLTPKGKRQLDAGRIEWQEFVRIVGGILGAPA